MAQLRAATRQFRGGLTAQAIAAIENALLDIKAKASACRWPRCSAARSASALPLYWSHSGTYRVRNRAMMGVPEIRSYDDLARHARGGARTAASGR